MVCLGNICRSPLAQGILEEKIKKLSLPWIVDSAGTSGWHIGEPPDARSVQKAQEYNIDITNQRSRKISLEDLDNFDLILAMDSSNFQSIYTLSDKKKHHDKIKLILNFVYPGQNLAVPDPYFDNSFQRVYDLLESAMDHLIEKYKSNMIHEF